MGALKYPGVGARLREAMLAAGYERPDGEVDVAAFIRRYPSFTRQHIYPWLNSGRVPELPVMTRLCEILKVSRCWLLLGDGDGGPKPAQRGRPAERMAATIAGGSANENTPRVDEAALASGRDAAYRTTLRRILQWVVGPLERRHEYACA